uniref:Uncharacterized protein n=1 Tax=Rhizophora mucronata TaxID=61149 RepID=A0A2P2PK00_RHIMU
MNNYMVCWPHTKDWTIVCSY